MPFDPAIFYVLIFIILAIFLVALSLGFLCFNIFSKYKNLKEEMFEKQKKEADQFKKTLEASKRQSLLVLEEAQSAARDIISKAQKVTYFNNSGLLQIVNDNLKAQKSSHDQAFLVIADSIKNTFSNFPEEVAKEIKREVSKLITRVEGDILEYKKIRQKTFEESLFEMLSRISKEVLGKELSQKEHEELVIKSLNQFKKEGVLEK